MLDDLKLINQIDTSDALNFVSKQPDQLKHSFDIKKFSNMPNQIVFTGMGGSSLVAELARTWPNLQVPYVVTKEYSLPSWVDHSTLVVVASYSGNTEETISALEDALNKNAQIVIITHGGKLLDLAKAKDIPYALLPECPQPRTGIFYAYRALIEIFHAAGLVAQDAIQELESITASLTESCALWASSVPTDQNYAKQLALQMEGKTPIIYGGPLTFPAAYKWKISVNENAKNTAWCNQLPEFNHNEFLGWSSHPVEKPFAVFDLISSYEDERVLKRFEVTDRLLSGKRPKATTVQAEGKTVLEQLLYLVLLGDYATTYLAILNHVDPTPVTLVENFKRELNK